MRDPILPGKPQIRVKTTMAVVVSLTVVSIIWPIQATKAEGLTSEEFSRAVSESHKALLRTPGGISISYHLYVNQDPRLGSFAWEEGQGEIRIHWPKLYNKFTGRSIQTHAETEREGEFDFDSILSAGRSKNDVQIAPFRQAWSSGHLFPLRLQFIEEAEQRYVPGKGLKTDYWLPSALDQAQYTFGGTAAVAGTPCDVYRRADNLDSICVAPKQGYVVVRGRGNRCEIGDS